MRFLSFGSFSARGEINARAGLLYSRLESPMYRPEMIFSVETAGWPGDWEGRTILALTLLAQTTGKEPAYLDEIVEQLEHHCNEKGYMRQILENGDVDEQQLSGHSWLLRGLCEYYLYRKNDPSVSVPVLKRIETIIENLFLPAAGRYREYPIRPEDRVEEGKESGHIGKKVGHWYLSSDTGCAYIPLDGVSHAYVLLDQYSGNRQLVSRLKELLDEMTANFYTIPFLEICVQTHATLTGCRGILRLYEHDRDPDKLAFVRKIFKLYCEEGMTANYANYNWFGKPDWTEPCAVIDSFMLAVQLYAHTGEMQYAEKAQRILYNALYAGQRANGGFGTDTCVGAENKPDNHLLACSSYEAYWCCSMRGGEGLASVSRCSILEKDNHAAVILYPMEGLYTVHGVRLQIRTSYPLGNSVTVKILDNPDQIPLMLELQQTNFSTCAGIHYSYQAYCHDKSTSTFVPSEIPKAGDTITWDLQPKLHCEPPEGNHNGNKNIYFYGNLVLGSVQNAFSVASDTDTLSPDAFSREGNLWRSESGFALIPIMNRYLQTQEEISAQKIRILF